jgi:LacI family transcriptional regulator
VTSTRRRAATLTDVAERAGVSIATASKALNQRGDVAADTRRRVLAAAEELAFQPNVLARGLLSGRTRTVGLLTDELGGRFAIPILLGVENTLGSQQMSVLLCDARGDAIRREHYIRTLLSRQIDGLIVVGETNDIRPSLTTDIPVPVIYVYGQSDNPADVSILADDHGGGRLAAEHLIGHGRTAIAHISGEQIYRAALDRAAGFTEALKEAGQTLVGGAPMYGDWTQRWGRHAARILLAAHPQTDAIFCASDQIATGVLDTLHDLGRRIPDDIALVGYDNWEVFAAESRPPLTTVDLNLQSIGAAAVEYLFAALDGHPGQGVVRCPTRLVVRESTGPRISQ